MFVEITFILLYINTMCTLTGMIPPVMPTATGKVYRSHTQLLTVFSSSPLKL